MLSNKERADRLRQRLATGPGSVDNSSPGKDSSPGETRVWKMGGLVRIVAQVGIVVQVRIVAKVGIVVQVRVVV